MGNSFVEQVCAVSADYSVALTAGYTTMTLRVSSTKNHRLTKAAVIYPSDMPTLEERDEYLTRKLIELVNEIKAEE